MRKVRLVTKELLVAKVAKVILVPSVSRAAWVSGDPRVARVTTVTPAEPVTLVLMVPVVRRAHPVTRAHPARLVLLESVVPRVTLESVVHLVSWAPAVPKEARVTKVTTAPSVFRAFLVFRALLDLTVRMVTPALLVQTVLLACVDSRVRWDLQVSVVLAVPPVLLAQSASADPMVLRDLRVRLVPRVQVVMPVLRVLLVTSVHSVPAVQLVLLGKTESLVLMLSLARLDHAVTMASRELLVSMAHLAHRASRERRARKGVMVRVARRVLLERRVSLVCLDLVALTVVATLDLRDLKVSKDQRVTRALLGHVLADLQVLWVARETLGLTDLTGLRVMLVPWAPVGDLATRVPQVIKA